MSRTPGGSSGGGAAIITAGGSPLDLGTDTGGSIRFPSHYCGIAGLKPTTGRVPRTGHIIGPDMGASQALTVVGPMARYVEDLELAFPIIAGPDYRDPHIVPVPIGDPGEVDLSSLRVAYYTESAGASPTPETARAVHDAAAALAEAGATVSEESPSALGAMEVSFLALIGADGFAWGDRLLERSGTTREHYWITMWKEMAQPLGTGDYTALLEELDRLRADMIAFMETRDLIVCPISAGPALLPRRVLRRGAHARAGLLGRVQPDGLAVCDSARGDVTGGSADRGADGSAPVAGGRVAGGGAGAGGGVRGVAGAGWGVGGFRTAARAAQRVPCIRSPVRDQSRCE